MIPQLPSLTDVSGQPPLRCLHAPGAGTPVTCVFLRAVQRLRVWADQAETAAASGTSTRQLIGGLWLLQAEVSAALDQCPSLVVRAATFLPDAFVTPREVTDTPGCEAC